MAMGLGGARADEMATDAAGRASPSASIPAGAARSNGQATAGFQTRADGSTSLSVETSQPLSYGTLVGRGRITYVLKGARVGHRNNSNPLVTVHFNTPVTRAQLLPRARPLVCHPSACERSTHRHDGARPRRSMGAALRLPQRGLPQRRPAWARQAGDDGRAGGPSGASRARRFKVAVSGR